ncbi:MAG: bifunctional diaminohydroxyphosphoribosylaminopyrimidine deaminase/5-amino-6-(5-phosphoribosylamino)uracil reductase RibD [Rhodobacteraceae bacterium]|nr:bifunctional diaminohydroxyphosphoribosylaminopyrimidine deaminase/5-amino-6-(5-phosphoribosylamino)uracil reductase RibD [Paracoccaceae bacterium]
MRLALRLGARGLGQVWPNPAVGCVIVKSDRVIGRGWTQPGGRPHAETQALEQAGGTAHGATVYVSLEPCAHIGQTLPCADALVAAAVARVVIAIQDPDPRTAGKGIARLRAAGIAVTVGVGEASARLVHAGFFARVTRNRPAVTLKLACSLDGRIATAAGESRWITGPKARAWVHATRAQHDAVLVGAGTVRRDNPGLTVRGLGPTPQPVRVVLSRTLDLPRDGQLARTARTVPLWLCHGPDAAPEALAAWTALGARCLPCRTAPPGDLLDVVDVMQVLGNAGLTRVLCEGGGALATALLAADMVDDLVGMTAGLILGAEGQPAIGAMGVTALATAPRLALHRVTRCGADTLTHWRRPATDTAEG